MKTRQEFEQTVSELKGERFMLLSERKHHDETLQGNIPPHVRLHVLQRCIAIVTRMQSIDYLVHFYTTHMPKEEE